MDTHDGALSALSWWQLAGVDVLVDEAPRDWLAPAKPAAAPAAILPPPPDALPETIEAMHALLATDPRFGASGGRVLPQGPAGADLAILADLPSADDVAAGALFTGAEGRLFDRMLAAIGVSRDAAYLCTLNPARPLTGQIPSADEQALGALGRHHLALARPRFILLLGESTSRSILGMEMAAARGALRHINHRDANLRAFATFHPRLLLGQAAYKAAAWTDLRMLIREMIR